MVSIVCQGLRSYLQLCDSYPSFTTGPEASLSAVGSRLLLARAGATGNEAKTQDIGLDPIDLEIRRMDTVLFGQVGIDQAGVIPSNSSRTRKELGDKSANAGSGPNRVNRASAGGRPSMQRFAGMFRYSISTTKVCSIVSLWRANRYQPSGGDRHGSQLQCGVAEQALCEAGSVVSRTNLRVKRSQADPSTPRRTRSRGVAHHGPD